jgi:hypothetical protein
VASRPHSTAKLYTLLEAAVAALQAEAVSYHEDPALDASRCRALFLEVIRRAAHDWVLYRTSRKEELMLAEAAYVWLFEEDENHPDRYARKTKEAQMMSLAAICDILDVSVETVRARIRKMTVRDIMTTGRPAENRKKRGRDCLLIEDLTSPPELDMVYLEELYCEPYYEQTFGGY